MFNGFTSQDGNVGQEIPISTSGQKVLDVWHTKTNFSASKKGKGFRPSLVSYEDYS